MVPKPPGGRPGMVGDEPVPGLTAAPACLAATPPAHTRLVCFVCCMVSLLFCSYLLFASGEPAAELFAPWQRLPLSHTFHEHSRVARPSDSLLPSDATHAAFEPFLWCHPRKQNGHTRHLVATKVGAVVFATRGRNDVACEWRMEPNAHGCRSSDRAGLCCVHRLGRGRGGRREGE